jgi:hypothetical protein
MDKGIMLMKIIQEISRNNFTEAYEAQLVKTLIESDIPLLKSLNFQDSFVGVYMDCIEFGIKWEQIQPLDEDDDMTEPSTGSINFLSIERIVANTKDYIYFGDVDPDDPITDFHIVDEFCAESCVGIYAGKHASNSLYFVDCGEAPVFLGLDLTGYIEMLCLSKGYYYWQSAILALCYGEENNKVEEMKERMPKLFPGWTWEAFVAKYDEVKIDENVYGIGPM